jgi:hypothetical protein
LLLKPNNLFPGIAILQEHFFSVLGKLWCRHPDCCWCLAELDWIGYRLNLSVVGVIVAYKEVVSPRLRSIDRLPDVLRRCERYLLKDGFPLVQRLAQKDFYQVR